MNKTIITCLGIIGVLVIGIIIIGGILVGQYNGLTQAKLAVETQWSQVETQYQRRFELIPNLVNTVKGYAAQEQQVFKDIADARTKYAGATSSNDKVEAVNQMESALGRLMVIVENYPQLKSDQLFIGLMAELSGTENRISVERRNYNLIVQDYNLKIRQFPSNLFAGIFGFKEAALFKSTEGAETAPVVDFEK